MRIAGAVNPGIYSEVQNNNIDLIIITLTDISFYLK